MTTLAPLPVSPRVVQTLALTRQFARFVAVGVVNTGLFLLVYVLLRTVLPITAASLVASVLTTFTSTNANGRVTFAADGPITARQHLKGMVATVVGLVITTGASAMVDDTAGEVHELVVLLVANSAAGCLRFSMLRSWVFPARSADAA